MMFCQLVVRRMEPCYTRQEHGGKVAYTSASESSSSLSSSVAYVCRAGRHLTNCASLSYAGSEHPLDIYEVLCGPADPSLIKWMTYRHGETAQVDGWQPVEAGREKDGTALLLAKGGYDNGEHPGSKYPSWLCCADADGNRMSCQ